MKHLRQLSALTLIVLVLFLSDARNGSANENAASPNPRNEQQGQSTEQPSHTPTATPSPTATQAFAPSPISTPKTQPRKDKSSNADEWFWPPIWSNWALVIAATIAAFIGLRTLDAIRRSNRIALRVARATKVASMATKQYVQMTTQMVEAAKQSARAAELALNTQRPYVFAESFRLEDHERRQLDLPLPLLTGTTGGHLRYLTIRQKWLWFELRSRGNGTAIIEAVRVRACIVRWSQGKPIWEGTKTQRLPISQRVIAPNGRAIQGTVIPNTVVPPVVDLLDRFAVIGWIRYREVFDRRYKSTFAYYYKPPANLFTPESAFFYLAGERHNRVFEIS